MEDSVSDPSAFDAEEFLTRLRQAGLEHARVVELRPSAEEVAASFERFGDLLSKFGEASRRLASLTVGVDPDQHYNWIPMPGSLAEADKVGLQETVIRFCNTPRMSTHWLATNPTRNPVDWGLQFSARCFKTTSENVGAVGVLGRSGYLRAPLTLMRSILEAGATACSLLEANCSPQERLRRVLNLHFAHLKEADLESNGSDYAKQYQTSLLELIAFAEFCGFQLKRYRPDRWEPPIIQPAADRPTESTRALIEQIVPGIGTSAWRNLSAVAHSREAHTLLYDEYSPTSEIPDWQRTEVLAREGIAALAILNEFCLRLEGYLGWEFSSWQDTILIVMQQLSVAAGMNDDAIRQHLGLPPVT